MTPNVENFDYLILENKMREELYVTTPQGKLVGKEWVSSFTGDTYYGFSGIPYAKPPLGELRFAAPQPADKWEGVLDATTEGEDCMQFSFLVNDIVGSEDCLYANIYTPEPPSKITTLKPVLVFFHWGANAWGSGSSKIFGCVDYLMNNDMVIVTFNHRLHIIGYLNLGIPECAGNMGLKDQVMLLRWIQNNIKYFGGNPNDVTLFGSSSGASNVHLHMMSPLSRGLFHKAIMQSGYCLTPIWSYQTSPYERAVELALVMGFSGLRTPKRLFEFFKQKSCKDLLNGFGVLRHLSKEKNDIRCEVCLFLPSIEKIEEGAFMLKSPREMIPDMAPIPAIFSINEKEGALAFFADLHKIIHKKLGRSIKENLWQYKISPDTTVMMTKKIRSFYFKKKEAPTTDEIINLYTDIWFSEWNNVIDCLANNPSRPPVYIYQFTYAGAYNFSKKWFAPICPKDITGAIHADDTSYVIAYKMYLTDEDGKIRYKQEESMIIKRMVSFIVNFVKHGNPNSDFTGEVNWKPYNPENPSHLQFGKTLSIQEDKINAKRVDFWNELIDYIKQKENSDEKENGKMRVKMSLKSQKENSSTNATSP